MGSIRRGRGSGGTSGGTAGVFGAEHPHEMIATTGFTGHEEAEANARLISAAPDMLEALRGLLVIVDRLNHDACKHGGPLREGESHEWLEQVKARAAIRKATGEQ